jgi:hypothetical protein
MAAIRDKLSARPSSGTPSSQAYAPPDFRRRHDEDLVTGATGFIGAAVARKLSQQRDAIVSTASIGQVEGTPDSFAKDRDAVAVMTKALGELGETAHLHQRFGNLRGLHQGRGQSDDFR